MMYIYSLLPLLSGEDISIVIGLLWVHNETSPPPWGLEPPAEPGGGPPWLGNATDDEGCGDVGDLWVIKDSDTTSRRVVGEARCGIDLLTRASGLAPRSSGVRPVGQLPQRSYWCRNLRTLIKSSAINTLPMCVIHDRIIEDLARARTKDLRCE